MVDFKYTYELVTVEVDNVIFKSRFGGAVYNEAKVRIFQITETVDNHQVVQTAVELTKPTSKKLTQNEAPLLYKTNDYRTLGALAAAINNDPLNNVFECVVRNEDYPSSVLQPMGVNNPGVPLGGGEDGVHITNDEMFKALSGQRTSQGFLSTRGSYQVLENYSVDYIYLAGVYADSKLINTTSNFHYELALLCAVLTYRTKMTHGFIDMKPNTNTTLVGIDEHVGKALAYNNIHYMKDETGNVIADENGKFLDLGWYTSLVFGPEPICASDTLGTYYGSPAIAYAALNATIKPQSAPTNKALPGVKGMRYKLSNRQLDLLTANRMVTFKIKGEGTSTATSVPYVVDGCTCGAPGTDYGRLSTVKVVTEVVDQVREVADPFIGEPNTVEQRNALAALISKRLSYLKEQGVIQYYEFEISASIQQVLIGECTIALTLVAPQELRKITTVVALKAAA
jgi:hypothetical protein